MPRRAKPPRLHLRSRKGRGRYWVILDRGREFGTGCCEGDRRRAEGELSRYLAQKHNPVSGEKRLEAIAVADVVNCYLREHAPATRSLEYLVHTAAPIIEWWGRKPMSDVRAQSCREYVAWRVGQGVSDQTARHDLSTLSAAIGHYHREHGPLPSVPVVTLPAKAPPRTDYWLTRRQVAERIRKARRSPRTAHLARLILIGIYTGTRPGAILGLKWMPSTDGGWFDLASRTLHRRAQGARESSKRQPPARIHARLLPHLRRWHRLDAARGVLHVVSYAGKRVRSVKTAWRAFGDRDGPHILRHTCATWLMQSGVPVFEAAGYLGMSEKVLREVYGHHHPEFQDRASGHVSTIRP